MYRVFAMKEVGKTTIRFYNQEIPATTSTGIHEKVKNKDIENLIEELLTDPMTNYISFWKYPHKSNKMTTVMNLTRFDEGWKDKL